VRILVLALLSVARPAFAESIDIQPHEEAADHRAEWRAFLAERRAVQIERLRAYAKAEVFPVNDFQPGFASILVDAEERPCAMASLVIQSGRAELIYQLASANNGLQFGDVRDGELYEWILTSGLTQEEAAFVQEPDFFVSDELPPAERRLLTRGERDRLRTHFLAAAAQLEAYSASSLESALDRLGERVQQPPPA
jgi:hypothetical protein